MDFGGTDGGERYMVYYSLLVEIIMTKNLILTAQFICAISCNFNRIIRLKNDSVPQQIIDQVLIREANCNSFTFICTYIYNEIYCLEYCRRRKWHRRSFHYTQTSASPHSGNFYGGTFPEQVDHHGVYLCLLHK